jgi:hypothetical protein
MEEFDEIQQKQLMSDPKIVNFSTKLKDHLDSVSHYNTGLKGELSHQTTSLVVKKVNGKFYIGVPTPKQDIEDESNELCYFEIKCFFYWVHNKEHNSWFISPNFIFNIKNSFHILENYIGPTEDFPFKIDVPQRTVDPEFLQAAKEMIKILNRYSFIQFDRVSHKNANLIKLILDLLKSKPEDIDIELLKAFIEIPEVAGLNLNELCEQISKSGEYSREALGIARELFECR